MNEEELHRGFKHSSRRLEACQHDLCKSITMQKQNKHSHAQPHIHTHNELPGNRLCSSNHLLCFNSFRCKLSNFVRWKLQCLSKMNAKAKKINNACSIKSGNRALICGNKAWQCKVKNTLARHSITLVLPSATILYASWIFKRHLAWKNAQKHRRTNEMPLHMYNKDTTANLSVRTKFNTKKMCWWNVRCLQRASHES